MEELKTPFAIFKDTIFTAIDRRIKVIRVIADDGVNAYVTVCSLKWLRIGDEVVDQDGNMYNVTQINTDDYILTLNRISHTAPVNFTTIITIPSLTLKSGTQMGVTAENSGKLNVGMLENRPWIWVRENYTGSVPPKGNWSSMQLEYYVYFVTDCDLTDDSNEDRHREAVEPMMRAFNAFIQTIDNTSGIFRVGDSSFKTFPIFGSEDKDGMIKLFLDLKLAGVECRVTVDVARKCCTKNC